MNLKPEPSEEDWEEMGLYDRCTCLEYEWDTICPYSADVWDELLECECCPYHSQECHWNI
jgi:hypothetical protein